MSKLSIKNFFVFFLPLMLVFLYQLNFFLKKINLPLDQFYQGLLYLVASLSLSFLITQVDKRRLSNGYFVLLLIFSTFFYIYTESISALILSSILLISLYFIGFSLPKFIILYGGAIFLFNIPNLFPVLPFKEAYYLLTFIYIVFAFFTFNKDRRNKVLHYRATLCSLDRFSIYTIVIVIFAHVFPFNFVWDDLNGYLWIPKISAELNSSQVSVKYPATLTFYSLHNLSLVSILSSYIANVPILTFTWKFLQALLYATSIILFALVFLKKSHGLSIKSFVILILLFPAYLASEVSGNQNDFPLYLSLLFSITIITSRKLINPFNLFISILLVIASPKSFVVLFPTILVNLLSHSYQFRSLFFNYKYYVSFIVGSLLLLPVYLRNYILSGNPTFPAGNDKIKSELFTDTGIVAGKVSIPDGASLGNFTQLLLNDPGRISHFYASDPLFYTFSIKFIIAAIFLTYLYKITFRNSCLFSKSYKIALRFLTISFVSFFILHKFIGVQHRYSLPIIALASIAGVFYLLVIQRNKFFVRYLYLFLFVITFSFSFNNPFSKAPWTYSDPFISSFSSKWHDRYEFYSKFNDQIEINDKILIYYLQDKVFIKSPNVHEIDWYDWPIMRELQLYMDRFKSNDELYRRSMLLNKLCSMGFSHLVLDDSHDPYGVSIRKSLRLLVSGTRIDAYSLPCGDRR